MGAFWNSRWYLICLCLHRNKRLRTRTHCDSAPLLLLVLLLLLLLFVVLVLLIRVRCVLQLRMSYAFPRALQEAPRQESMWVARQALHGKRLPSCRTCQTRIYFWQTNKTIKPTHTHTHTHTKYRSHNIICICSALLSYRKLFDFLATFDLKTKSSNQDDIYTHTYTHIHTYIQMYRYLYS